jgi:hypothetical protein
MPELNARREAFCRALIKGMSAAQAWAKAGYDARGRSAEANASRLLTNAAVQARLNELRTQAGEKAVAEASEAWIVEQAVLLYKRCMQQVAVLDADGNETGEYRFEPGPAVRALDLLARRLGLYAERHEVDQTIKIIAGQPLTEEEWEKKHRPQLPAPGAGNGKAH